MCPHYRQTLSNFFSAKNLSAKRVGAVLTGMSMLSPLTAVWTAPLVFNNCKSPHFFQQYAKFALFKRKFQNNSIL
jgi:hypothetical protein